jgi:2-succinyl-5-enolpyruvyl-6-hydroxy-3-cyclohexene-1-carboxylate synthase
VDVNNCISAFISGINASAAVVSPGSRNAPLIYALNQRQFPLYSIIDERSAGFIALGLAKAQMQPVILNCTSGTAVLNYYPAIAEAYYARVPLIVLTADRPPELIDQWDGQAIRQNGVFANHICREFTTPDTYSDVDSFLKIANQVNAYWESNIPGPIHINIPIREPFYASLKAVKQAKSNAVFSARRQRTSLLQLQKHLNQDFAGKKILVFNGMTSGENIELEIDCLEEQTVQLSDVTSHQQGELRQWDSILYNAISANFSGLEMLQPDILITTGTTTVSKGLKLFLRKHQPKQHFHISHFKHVGKMFGTSPIVVDPDCCIQLDEPFEVEAKEDTPYKKLWKQLEASANQTIGLLDWKDWNEFTATRNLLEHLLPKTRVHVGNSMPIRYASFCTDVLNKKDVQVYGNRGTSGIDGCTSTAVGYALASEKQVFLITGDVAFLYDINALLSSSLPGNLKIIVLNNRGGGIFELIPGPEKMGESSKFQTTEHDVDLESLCNGYGIEHLKAKNHRQLKRALYKMQWSDACMVLEVATNRADNRTFFELWKNTLSIEKLIPQ